jgi:antitoxin component YwqK of YwqJK toxin-antitoxin module
MGKIRTIAMSFLIALNLMPHKASAQDTIWVKDDDEKFMEPGSFSMRFRSNLPDGHYCAYYGDKKFVKVEATFVNRKKEGVETAYGSRSTEIYSIVTWHKGRKNGQEIWFNGNGTPRYILNFRQNKLDGYCEVNWIEGEKYYCGFYRNGFRDSIWTYYANDNKISSLFVWKSRQYKYNKGKKYLISAWDKNGVQTITNGNGLLTDSGYEKTTTPYLNGLKNGKSITTRHDGTLACERIYKDNLLIQDVLYYYNESLAVIYNWKYMSAEQIDTVKNWVENVSGETFNEILFTNLNVPTGHWIAYYPNGTKIYEGNYKDGNRTGTWYWFYENGKPRITADYSKNDWQHFDETGNLISNIKNEYLSVLTNGYWFLNQELGDKTIMLVRNHCKTITPRFVFYFDGHLEINSFLECGKDIDFSLNYFKIHVDTLRIKLSNRNACETNTYKYKIISATGDVIKMQRIESMETKNPVTNQNVPQPKTDQRRG